MIGRSMMPEMGAPSRLRWAVLLAAVAASACRAGGLVSSPLSYSDETFNRFSGSDGYIDLAELRQLVSAINASMSADVQQRCAGGVCEQGCDVVASMRSINGAVSDGWKLNRTSFELSCPSLLYVMTHNCSENRSIGAVADASGSGHAPSLAEVWGYGFLFMILINATTLVGVLVLPLRGKAAYEVVVMFLVALAMGCLVGNGMFVLIPEAFEIVDQEHYLYKSLAIVCGIYVFYIMERLMEVVAQRGCCRSGSGRRSSTVAKASESAEIKDTRTNGLVTAGCLSPASHHHHHHHHHNHSLLAPELGAELQSKAGQPTEDSTAVLVDCAVNGGDLLPVGVEKPLLIAEDSAGNLQALPQSADVVLPATRPITTVAYMVLVGHGFHNFIDGMSIGAAFTSNKLLGISLSLAVICEEIPHGLGDFAILLSAGFGKKKAVLYNFLSGCPCYAGLVVGIKLAEVMHAAPWILGIAGGIFIYIGLADMLPEIKAAEESSPEPVKTFFIQNVGIVCGAAVIAAMAYFGKSIQL